METSGNRAVAGKGSRPWRPSHKVLILGLLVIALVFLGIGVSIHSLSGRGRNNSSGQPLDGMMVFFNIDRTSIEKICVHGEELNPGLAFEALKQILGEPQTVTQPAKLTPNGAAASKTAPSGEFLATYYIGHDYYLFYFDAGSPPRIKQIQIDGGY